MCVRNHPLMKLVATTLVVLSLQGLLTSGWRDVLNYPEFVKHVEDIGNYEDHLDLGLVPNNNRAFVDLVMKAVEYLRREEKGSMMKKMKRYFSSYQLGTR